MAEHPGVRIQRVIDIIEGARSSHVRWMGYQSDGATVDDEVAGDIKFHQGCIEDYDEVLKVLRESLVRANS